MSGGLASSTAGMGEALEIGALRLTDSRSQDSELVRGGLAELHSLLG
ncbi:hypothetical protein [Streptomyces sp. cg40]